MFGSRNLESSVGNIAGEQDVKHHQAKVHAIWNRTGISIRYYQVFQNVKFALHGNRRPDNVIPGRN